jgi:hypothetical protein
MGSHITEQGIMCIDCGDSYKEERERLKNKHKAMIRRELASWIRQQKTVKRFYRRQRVLPLDGGDQ